LVAGGWPNYLAWVKGGEPSERGFDINSAFSFASHLRQS
jgi:hypothetical protein